MHHSFVTPKTAAILGLLLIIPSALFLSLLMLGIEPPLGPLKPLLTAPPDQPNVIGSVVALTLIVGLPGITFLLNIRPLTQSFYTGSNHIALHLNLLLVITALIVVFVFVAGVIFDQYPCWIGVPNCD